MITITIKAVAGGFVASVNTTKGPIEGKPCTSPKFAVKSLRAVTKAAGRELPPANELNLIGDITPAVIPTNSAIEFINDDSTPAVQPMEAAPDTEREPELHPALVTPAGLITPVTEPERWLGAYNLAKMAIGPEGQPVDLIKVMKAAGFASPWSLDGQGRAFHTYTEARKEIVPAPKAGEGARRILQNNNGYNRDFKGRTPMEPGSLARETDARHPGNRPERNAERKPGERPTGFTTEPSSFKFKNTFGIFVPDIYHGDASRKPMGMIQVNRRDSSGDVGSDGLFPITETRFYEATKEWRRSKAGNGWVTFYPRRVEFATDRKVA